MALTFARPAIARPSCQPWSSESGLNPWTYQGQGVAQKNEPRRVVGKIVGDLVQGLVDYLVLVLADLMRILID